MVDINLLISDMENGVITRSEAHEQGQQYIREQQQATGVIGTAEAAIETARTTYLQAISDYKNTLADVNRDIRRLEQAINKGTEVPFARVGNVVRRENLLLVTLNQVNNA